TIRLPTLERVLIVAEQPGERHAREAIDGLPLGDSGLQADLLRLTVHDDEVRRELAEHTDRRCTPPVRCATAPVGADRSAEDEVRRAVVTLVDVASRIPDPLGDGAGGVDLPVTFDDRVRAPRTHGAAVGTFAEQQSQSRHDHGLAGTRLAR